MSVQKYYWSKLSQKFNVQFSRISHSFSILRKRPIFLIFKHKTIRPLMKWPIYMYRYLAGPEKWRLTKPSASVRDDDSLSLGFRLYSVSRSLACTQMPHAYIYNMMYIYICIYAKHASTTYPSARETIYIMTYGNPAIFRPTKLSVSDDPFLTYIYRYI